MISLLRAARNDRCRTPCRATHCFVGRSSYDVKGGCLRFKYGGTLRLSRGICDVADQTNRPSPASRAPTRSATALGCSKPRRRCSPRRAPMPASTRSPRTAGVGIGTLYRHFPTRDALIEAVYRNETRAARRRPPPRLAETHAAGRGVARLAAAVRRPHRHQAGACPRRSTRSSAARPSSTRRPARR